MKTTPEDLRDDLMRRADTCDLLARNYNDTGAHGDARRCEGEALAYRHAAELLRVSPLVADAARLTAERNAVRDRARKAAQVIIAAIGADGPQNIVGAAERIVERLRHSEAAEAALRAARGGAG